MAEQIIVDDEAVRVANALIADEFNALRDFVIQKNTDYSNAALDPVRCFSKMSAIEQIKTRIDDKISRLERSFQSETGMHFPEDTIADLIGYLVLLRVALRREIGFPENG